MDTPGLENDHTNPTSPAHAGSPETQLMPPPVGSQLAGQSPQSQLASSKNFSGVPHMRSRITVVCAECKRLKLKCDRRTPCGSCLKRDTVQRCIYSQAAAEKIDVQSLHNRLLVVEGTLAQMTAHPQAGLSVAPFKSAYPALPPSLVLAGPSSLGLGLGPSAPAAGMSRVNAGSVLAGLPCNERACLVAGPSGSSVLISLEDTASIWLNELECSPPPEERDRAPSSSLSPYSSAAKAGTPGAAARVKLEPTPVLVPPRSATLKGHPRGVGPARRGGFVPPVPFKVFLPSDTSSLTSYGPPGTSSQAFTSTFSSVPDGPSTSASPRPDVPQVTTALLAYLPQSPETRQRYLEGFEEVMPLHHTVNVRHLKKRIEAMFAWSEPGAAAAAKADLAKELFCGAPPATSKKAGRERGGGAEPAPTLSFFAVACAAFALGALIARAEPGEGTEDGEHAPRTTPAGLFALSEQALAFFERTASYDVDSVVALLLQILFELHDGRTGVAQGVAPRLARAVGVARLLGLHADPDEFPGTYGLFEAEVRRRVWWDVYYYDMLVGECMGMPGVVGEGTFSTRHVAETDDERFGPSSVSVPGLGGEPGERGTTYFLLRNRLTQLIRTIRQQTSAAHADGGEGDAPLEQAVAHEAELSAFLEGMPDAYRLPQDCDPAQPPHVDAPAAKAREAQRCILAIIAKRAILKLYLPFLKDSGATASASTQGGGGRPAHQAVLGCINASHAIIYAGRVLHSLWRDARPAVFDFYDFGRTLFDAAVLCAHAVLQQPGGVLAREALGCVGGALQVLRAISRERVGGESAEAIKVVEVMKERAERARGEGEAGTKRKREEDARPVTLTPGFQLPFVGPAVCSAKPEPSRAPLQIAKAAVSGPRKDEARAVRAKDKDKDREREREREKDRDRERDRDREKDREKEKKKLPSWGIRSRPSSGQALPPPVRQRTNSMAPSAGTSASPVATTHMQGPPTSAGGPLPASSSGSHASSPAHTSHTSTPPSDVGVSPGYAYPAQSTSPNPNPMQQEQAQAQGQTSTPMQRDFQLGYPDGGDAPMAVDARGYAQGYAGASQPPQYDQRAGGASYGAPSHTSPSYRTTPAPPEYFVQQPYGAPLASPTYDQSRMPPAQGLPMQAYPLEPGMGGAVYNNGSIPGTPAAQTYMLGADKAAPPYSEPQQPHTHQHAQQHQHTHQHPVGKSELDRQMGHEYPPTATSHGVALTASQMATQFVQGWPQQAPQEMSRQHWDYKYYGS